jgi:thioredoxin 1
LGVRLSNFISINENNFEETVLKSGLPILVEFGAPWCVPCRSLEPELVKLSENWQGRNQLAKVNVDECADLVAHYQIMSVPTLILFVQGKAVQRTTGYLPRQRLQEQFESFLA